MTVTMTMAGLKELQETIRRLPNATAKSIMVRTLKEVAKPIKEQAQADVPTDSRQLQRSIVISTRLSKRQFKIHKRNEKKHDVYVFVGAGKLPHAHLIEYGTTDMDAQPFLRPAWDANKVAAFIKIKKTMWDEINRVANKRK